MNELSAKPLEGQLLARWKLPPCDIGGRRFEGNTELVEVVEVTYQQKSHTHGYINGVSGVTIDGYGGTTGGGGYITTHHENVATTIVRDGDGIEIQLELPSRIALRSGSHLRLDRVNRNLIGATNVSGKGELNRLMCAEDFFPKKRFQKKFLVLALIGLLFIAEIFFSLTAFIVVVLLCAPLGFWLVRNTEIKRNQNALGEYMRDVYRHPLTMNAVEVS